jgi:hypothetical protein
VYDVTSGTGTLLGQKVEICVSSIVLSQDGKRVATGNIADDIVKVYELVGSLWTQVGSDITGLSSSVTEYTGIDLALSSDGMVLALGATKFPSTTEDNGYGEVYDCVDNNWILRGGRTFNLRNSEESSEFGYQVVLSSDGSRVVFGAPGQGKVFTYDWSK